MDNAIKLILVVTLSMAIAGFFMFAVPLSKAFTRRLERREGAGSVAEELDALRAEVLELRPLPERLAELEERLDFAERLLAQRDAERLPRGKDD